MRYLVPRVGSSDIMPPPLPWHCSVPSTSCSCMNTAQATDSTAAEQRACLPPAAYNVAALPPSTVPAGGRVMREWQIRLALVWLVGFFGARDRSSTTPGTTFICFLLLVDMFDCVHQHGYSRSCVLQTARAVK